MAAGYRDECSAMSGLLIEAMRMPKTDGTHCDACHDYLGRDEQHSLADCLSQIMKEVEAIRRDLADLPRLTISKPTDERGY